MSAAEEQAGEGAKTVQELRSSGNEASVAAEATEGQTSGSGAVANLDGAASGANVGGHAEGHEQLAEVLDTEGKGLGLSDVPVKPAGSIEVCGNSFLAISCGCMRPLVFPLCTDRKAGWPERPLGASSLTRIARPRDSTVSPPSASAITSSRRRTARPRQPYHLPNRRPAGSAAPVIRPVVRIECQARS